MNHQKGMRNCGVPEFLVASRSRIGAAVLALAAGNAQAQPAVEAGVLTAQTGENAKPVKVAQSGGTARSQTKTNAAGSATQGQAMAGPKCTGDVPSPGRLSVPLGKSTLLRLPEPVVNRTIGNPEVVQAMMVSPQTLYVLGVDLGTTNMIIQGRSGTCTTIDVVVGMDPAGLQSALSEFLPDEKNIRVSSAADTLVMSGTVADATAVSRAVELANAFVRRPAAEVQSGVQPAGKDGGGAGMQGAGQRGQQSRIVNLLNVAAPQQVMLEVKVAEVSKSLLDKLGVGSALQTSSGSWTYTLLSNFLTGTANGLLDATKTNGNSVTLEAERRDGLVKILAEPTVMAISGQEGNFLAGGKILIPVAQDSVTGGTRITLEEKEFGVGLRFTPTVLAGGRINLKVAPEVSELSREGVGITAIGVTGRAILPLITTRRASTTVQLFDGQSFAIGGLIKNNVVSNIKALPILGEVPVLGALFRSTDFQQDKSELLFVVTPRLVKPLPPNYALPTDKAPNPTRPELFLEGRLEGKAAEPKASPQTGTPPAGEPVQQGSLSGFELK